MKIRLLALLGLLALLSGCSSIQSELQKLPPQNVIGATDNLTTPFFSKDFSCAIASKGTDGSINASHPQITVKAPLIGVIWTAGVESYSQPAGGALPTAQPITSSTIGH